MPLSNFLLVGKETEAGSQGQWETVGLGSGRRENRTPGPLVRLVL